MNIPEGVEGNGVYPSYTSGNPAYGVLVPGMMPTFVSFPHSYIPPSNTAPGPSYPISPISYEQHVQSLQRDTSAMLEFPHPNPYAMAGGRYPHIPPPPSSYMSRPHYSPYAFGPMGGPPRGVPFGWQHAMPAPLPGAPLGPNPFLPYPPAAAAVSRMHTPHIARRRSDPRPTRHDRHEHDPINLTPRIPEPTPSNPSKGKTVSKRSLSESNDTQTPKLDSIDSEEDGQCCICLEEPSTLELASINGCTHNFCFTCIEKWSERENTCPLCKTRFTKIDRVNKPPPYKKRKRGEQRTKLTKKVRNRDQRADVSVTTMRMPNISHTDPGVDRRRPIVLFSNLPGSLLSLHNALGIPNSAAASSALNELAARHHQQHQTQPPIPFEFGRPDDFYWRI